MNHVIREARAEDASAVSGLVADLGYELDTDGVISNLGAYSSIGSKVWIGEANRHVVGFVSFHVIPLFHTRDDLGRITAMAVASSHRRMGIGRLLLERAEEFAWQEGCVRIEITSADHRECEGHRFYESAGYVVDCRRFVKARPAIKKNSGTATSEDYRVHPAPPHSDVLQKE